MYTERDQFPSPSKASKKAARKSNDNINNTFPLISSFNSSTSSSSSSSSATTHDTVDSEALSTISATPSPNLESEKGTTESHVQAAEILSSSSVMLVAVDADGHMRGDDGVIAVPMVVDQPLTSILSSSSITTPSDPLASNTAYSDPVPLSAPTLPITTDTPVDVPIRLPSLSYQLSMTRSTVPLPPIPGITTAERILWLTPSTTNTSSSSSASSSRVETDISPIQHQLTQFKPPVYLAPLIRKRFKRRLLPGRRVPVPLIEPEICDVYDGPFLPMSILSKGGYADDGGRSIVEDKWVLRQTAGQPPQAPPTAGTDGTVGAGTSIAGVRAYESEQRGEQGQSTVQAVQSNTVTTDQGEGNASIDNNHKNNNNHKTRDAGEADRAENHNSSRIGSNGQCAKRIRLTIDSGHYGTDAADKIPQ